MSPDSEGRRASPPTKLDKLRFAGYSAEFLDRVEPNGNIPDRYALGKIRAFLVNHYKYCTRATKSKFSGIQNIVGYFK